MNMVFKVILSFFILISFYLGLGYYALENINEGVYAEIAREMLVNKNFILPTLNYVSYFEKPPLLYWLITLSFKIFGLNEFAARFIPATSASVICFMTYYFIKRSVNERTGLIAALMLASNFLFVLMGRIVLFDMLLTAFFTAGLYSFYVWYSSENKYYLRLAYACLAFAVLSKGLMVFIFAPLICFIFMSLNKTPVRKQLQLFDPIGIALLFLIAAPWHIMASLQNSEFAWQYFINEHVLRFLDKRIPNDYHHGPWYFYFPRLFIYLLPWTLLSPLILKPASDKALNCFCWTWFITILIFFSISKAKGDYYMIMGMPPLIILLADRITNTRYSKHIIPLFSTLVGSVMFLFLLVLWISSFNTDFSQYLPKKLHIPSDLAQPLAVLVALMGLYCIFSVIFYRTLLKNKTLQIILYAALIIPLVIFLLVDKKHLEYRFSEKANAELTHGDAYIYKHYEDLSSFPFYLRQRVKIIDSQSCDLYFGSTQPEAEGWFISMKEFLNKKRTEPTFILVKKGNYPGLMQALGNLKSDVLSDNKNVYLIKL